MSAKLFWLTSKNGYSGRSFYKQLKDWLEKIFHHGLVLAFGPLKTKGKKWQMLNKRQSEIRK